MNYYIFDNQPNAAACQAAVDANLGYPRDSVPPGAITVTYADVTKHQSQNFWGYPSNTTIDDILVPLAPAILGFDLPTPQPLPAGWLPAFPG